MTYYKPTDLNRHVLEVPVIHLFIAKSTKLQRLLLLLLDRLANMTNRSRIMIWNPFSWCTIDDVTALLAVDNKGKDVLIVEKHILLSLPVVNSFLNQLETLLIDIILMSKHNMVTLDLISTLDTMSISSISYFCC